MRARPNPGEVPFLLPQYHAALLAAAQRAGYTGGTTFADNSLWELAKWTQKHIPAERDAIHRATSRGYLEAFRSAVSDLSATLRSVEVTERNRSDLIRSMGRVLRDWWAVRFVWVVGLHSLGVRFPKRFPRWQAQYEHRAALLERLWRARATLQAKRSDFGSVGAVLSGKLAPDLQQVLGARIGLETLMTKALFASTDESDPWVSMGAGWNAVALAQFGDLARLLQALWEEPNVAPQSLDDRTRLAALERAVRAVEKQAAQTEQGERHAEARARKHQATAWQIQALLQGDHVQSFPLRNGALETFWYGARGVAAPLVAVFTELGGRRRWRAWVTRDTLSSESAPVASVTLWEERAIKSAPGWLPLQGAEVRIMGLASQVMTTAAGPVVYARWESALRHRILYDPHLRSFAALATAKTLSPPMSDAEIQTLERRAESMYRRLQRAAAGGLSELILWPGEQDPESDHYLPPVPLVPQVYTLVNRGMQTHATFTPRGVLESAYTWPVTHAEQPFRAWDWTSHQFTTIVHAHLALSTTPPWKFLLHRQPASEESIFGEVLPSRAGSVVRLHPRTPQHSPQPLQRLAPLLQEAVRRMLAAARAEGLPIPELAAEPPRDNPTLDAHAQALRGLP